MLLDTVIPPEAEEEQLRELNRMLQVEVPALVGADGERIELPQSVYGILKDVVRNLQAGRAITLVPEKQQLTTQRAANLLGVSRPHLVQLLTEGKLPYHMVGSHRRVYLADLLEYKQRRDTERHAALDELARQAFAAGQYEGTGIPEGGSDE